MIYQIRYNIYSISILLKQHIFNFSYISFKLFLKSNNNDNNTDVDNINTNVSGKSGKKKNDNNTDVDNTNVSGKSGKKKNERKKSGRISNQPRKGNN